MFGIDAKYRHKNIKIITYVTSRVKNDHRGWNLRLEDRRKEVGKMHDLFFKRVMGLQTASMNCVCVKEFGRTNRKNEVLE
jgi:hypothetical protein